MYCNKLFSNVAHIDEITINYAYIKILIIILN